MPNDDGKRTLGKVCAAVPFCWNVVIGVSMQDDNLTFNLGGLRGGAVG